MPDISPDTIVKWEQLLSILKNMDSVITAYSGGVDSSLLLYAAHLELGDNCQAITVSSELDIPGQRKKAEQFAAKYHIPHRVIELELLQDEKIASNPPERCYFCKGRILSLLHKIANEEGLRFVIEGQNMDDLGDYRPGRMAVEETHTRSPFLEAKLNKAEIRAISKALNLETWDQPSSPCLATRIPYGMRLNTGTLEKIALCETYIHKSLGLPDCRVRVFNQAAVIEVPEDSMQLVFENREPLFHFITEAGFSHAALNLASYRRGSLNPGKHSCK